MLSLTGLKSLIGGFVAAAILFGILTIHSAIKFFVSQQKFMNYLLKNHTEKWKELNTYPIYGPSFRDTFRGFRFYFDEDSLDDPEVLRLKAIVRKSYICMALGIVTTMVTIFIAGCLYINLRGQ